MSVQMREFGKTADGRTVHLYRLTNKTGAWVQVLDYGCTLHSICVPDKNGTLTDVCLGYDTVAEYEANDGYLGALIGRYANRIGGGKFSLNGKDFSLAVNDGPNHLHGGNQGFDKYIWSSAVASDRLLFTRVSPDGEEGYPGNLFLSVIYAFEDDNSLILAYDASCDADTPINLTNHCYFNLNGQGTGSISDLKLRVCSDSFLENDTNCLPTGRILSVEGTPFDFRTLESLGSRMDSDDENLKNGNGYDHTFVLQGEGLREVACLTSEKTGISLTVHTTQPGMQVYTGNFLTDRKGKGGTQYGPRDGICLETQHHPDGVNHENFPCSILRKDENYHQVTKYTFTVNGEERQSI